jgi:hypothetical protein
MSTTGRLEYDGLLRLLKQGQGAGLDIHVHRYFAVAKNLRVGYYSTLAMAFQEVDNRRQFRCPSYWEATANWPRPESYVIDLVTGKVYERVAQGSRAGSEPTLA